jgi:hypothetical protein
MAATQLTAGLGFEDVGLQRIGVVAVENYASQRVSEKARAEPKACCESGC